MSTNWSDIIRSIEATGMSLTAIAEAIGLKKSSTSEIKSGRTAEPRGDAAVKLRALYEKRTRAAAKRRPTSPNAPQEAA